MIGSFFTGFMFYSNLYYVSLLGFSVNIREGIGRSLLCSHRISIVAAILPSCALGLASPVRKPHASIDAHANRHIFHIRCPCIQDRQLPAQPLVWIRHLGCGVRSSFHDLADDLERQAYWLPDPKRNWRRSNFSDQPDCHSSQCQAERDGCGHRHKEFRKIAGRDGDPGRVRCDIEQYCSVSTMNEPRFCFHPAC